MAIIFSSEFGRYYGDSNSGSLYSGGTTIGSGFGSTESNYKYDTRFMKEGENVVSPGGNATTGNPP
jgi:hypothetical protein